MGADVHLQGPQGDIHLLAVLTAEGLLGGGVFVSSTMELLMFAEAGVGGVGLGAERALVSRRGVIVLRPLGGGVTRAARAGGS